MADKTAHAHASPAPHGEEHDHASFAHPMPVNTLLGVFVALVFLTILTVVISENAERLMLGRFEVWVSMGIATIKASLVIFFFMHLLYDKPFNKMIFFSAFFFVFMFVGITLMDTNHYQDDIKAYNGELLPARKVGGEQVADPVPAGLDIAP